MRVRSVLLWICLGLAGCSLLAQGIQINKDNKSINISASAEASALADTAIVTIGFQSFGKEQDQTYAEAARTSNAIVTALQAVGVLDRAIQSSDQTLHSLEPGAEPDRTRYAEGLRFFFSQSWQVTVPAADAAKVLSVAVQAGANQSGTIQWELGDESALQSEAAAKALGRAHELAAKMAQGLGSHLGALLYASNQTSPQAISGSGIGSGRGGNLGGGYMERKNLLPLAIRPQRITRSATVYAVFAIE